MHIEEDIYYKRISEKAYSKAFEDTKDHLYASREALRAIAEQVKKEHGTYFCAFKYFLECVENSAYFNKCIKLEGLF